MLATAQPLPPDAADAVLLAQAAGGARGAWDALVARYQRRVLVSLLALGLGLDEARDVTQDTWARLWDQHRQGALASLTLPGLAITQARFLAQDLLRRRRATPTEEGTPLPDAVAPAADAEAALISTQALARVQRALARQSATKRDVFRLACDEGLAHAEVARRVGLSTQRVRQIVWEVRTALRAELEEPS